MDRIWLKSYPAGVPADIDPDEVPLAGRAVRQEHRASTRDRPAFHSMGKTITLRRARQALSRDFGAWLQARGLAKGARVAIMMPNCLQYPVAMFGTLRAGCTVVNVNPLYTPRELEHQLKDSGAEAIVILENFGHVLQEVRARTPIKHVVVTSLGEMLGVKGVIVNLVVRKVKKMVPAYELPGRDLLQGGAERRQRQDADHAAPGARRHRLPAVHRRHHRRVEGRDAASTATSSPRCCSTRPGSGRRSARSAPVIITALPLYHIFSLTVNCLVMMVVGGENVLITNPRDIPGFVKELGQAQVHA